MQEPVLTADRLATPKTRLQDNAPQLASDVQGSIPWPRLLPALATGLLLILGHFTILPIVSGWFAWVALVPMLCLVRSEARPWRIYLSVWAGASLFFWFVLQWMPAPDPRMYYTWAMLATWCSLFVPVGIFLIRRLERRTKLPLIATVPLVWVGLEFIRAHLLTGFPWYFLGHTQHNVLPVIQIADLGGAYAVSFVVAAVNALIFELLYGSTRFRRLFDLPASAGLRRPALAFQILLVAVLVGGMLGYGFWRLHEEHFQQGPRLAVIQGNVPQSVRNERHDAEDEKDRIRAADEIAQTYLTLHDIAERGKPELVVWPETSYPSDWYEKSDEIVDAGLAELRQRYAKANKGVQPPSWEWVRQAWLDVLNERMMREVRTWPTNVLLGLNTEVDQLNRSIKRFNSAVLLQPGGKYGGRYDKIHRVPWGEYVPLRDWIPSMDAFAPYDHDYSIAPGEQLTRFSLGKYHFGVVICYEDSDPYLARQFVRPGGGQAPLDFLTRFVAGGMYSHLPAGTPGDEPVDFLINTSNDGWFDGTAEHEEHLAICRFRAIECRRSVVRAVNMGISAVIDGSGRVLAPKETQRVGGRIPVWEIEPSKPPQELPPERWKEFKKVAGVLVANVPLDDRESFYAQWGDWLPAGCWLLIAVGLIWPVRRRMID